MIVPLLIINSLVLLIGLYVYYLITISIFEGFTTTSSTTNPPRIRTEFSLDDYIKGLLMLDSENTDKKNIVISDYNGVLNFMTPNIL